MTRPAEIIPALCYYNIIADEYDNFMVGDSDQRVREMVSNEFMKTIPSGNILDFGGGTGQDLRWLLRNPSYHVFFFEPSYNMRSIAQKNISMYDNMGRPAFIGQNLPVSNWSYNQLPTNEKMNGVLANFAVLNCIQNIDEFFEKLSLVCNSGCHVVATVLNASITKMVTKYPFRAALSALLSGRATIYNNYHGVGHATYLHTIRQLKAAAGRHFDFVSCKPLRISDFALIKFIRK